MNATNIPSLAGATEVSKKENDAPVLSDTELSIAAGRGEMTAFEELYKRHNRRVYAICLRMTRNQHEAEDLTQDVFVELFRKLDTFRGESAFTTWLYRVTVNVVLMNFRKKRLTIEDRAEHPEQIAPGTEDAARMPILDRISIKDAANRLAPGYYKVFLLHDVEGYAHHEIAEIFGFTICTSKSQLHKARLKLRGFLGERRSVLAAQETN